MESGAITTMDWRVALARRIYSNQIQSSVFYMRVLSIYLYLILDLDG